MMFQVFFLRFIARKVTSLDTSCEGRNSTGDGDISNINSKISKNSGNQSQSHILKVYNSSLGCPTAAMHSGMTEEHAAIMTVSNYPEFFQRVHLFFTPQQFTSMLRNAVRISVQRNYTTGVNLNTLGCCKIERTNIAGEALTDSTDPGPCREQILWDDVWKMHALEKAGGPYSPDKVIEMRKKVSSSKRQYQQQQQHQHQQQQQQQQQLQLRNSRAASPCRKSGYASGNNKATNNYNYMLRGSQSSYYRAGDNPYPINNGNGRHGYGYGYGQGQGQGVGTAMRHPYRPKSGISGVSGGGSAVGSVETAALLLGAHNGSSGMNNNNNNSYNYSNYNNNYSTNNSHSRNRPSQARNALQKQDIRRTGNSAENLCSLLNGAATSGAPLGAAHSGQSSVNGNNNNSNNNNDSNNSKPRTKFSHKNSTMNNAMSVSGDRVRLHVFYQVILYVVCNGLQGKRSVLIKKWIRFSLIWFIYWQYHDIILLSSL